MGLNWLHTWVRLDQIRYQNKKTWNKKLKAISSPLKSRQMNSRYLLDIGRATEMTIKGWG